MKVFFDGFAAVEYIWYIYDVLMFFIRNDDVICLRKGTWKDKLFSRLVMSTLVRHLSGDHTGEPPPQCFWPESPPLGVFDL